MIDTTVVQKNIYQSALVTSHADIVFQRLTNTSNSKILHELQKGRWIYAQMFKNKPSLVFLGIVGELYFYAPVIEFNEQSCIPTILGADSNLKQKIRDKKEGDFVSFEQIEIFLYLESKGFTQIEISKLTGWSKSCVGRHLADARGVTLGKARWTEEEEALLARYLLNGLDTQSIAERLGRTQTAIKVKAMRRKRERIQNENWAKAGWALKQCFESGLSPGKALSAVRRSRII